MNSVMPIRPTKYLPSLDGLRGFFILCVVMTHINVSRAIITDPRITLVVNNALFGVRYFFVISGFLITTLLLKEQAATGSISMKNFYFRRTLRILPVAYSFLITMVVLNRCWHLGITSGNFLASFLFFKNFRLATSGFLEHFWSLSIEEQYYLLLPFVLTRGLKTYLIVCFAIIALYFANNAFDHFLHVPPPVPGGPKRLTDTIFSISQVSIILGSFAAILIFRYGDRILTVPWNTTVLTLVEAAAIVLAFILFYWIRFFGLTSFLSSCLIAFTIVLLTRFPQGPIYAILNNRVLAFIGKMSFSIYVWQQLFCTQPPWAHWFKAGDSIIFNVIALAVFSLFIHFAIERPFMRLRSRYRPVPPQ
jgi:peptidoglycan/LPS O-acetylase OafA/YrhL